MEVSGQAPSVQLYPRRTPPPLPPRRMNQTGWFPEPVWRFQITSVAVLYHTVWLWYRLYRVQVPALTYGVVMVQTVQGAGTSFNVRCGYGTGCTGCRYQL